MTLREGGGEVGEVAGRAAENVGDIGGHAGVPPIEEVRQQGGHEFDRRRVETCRCQYRAVLIVGHAVEGDCGSGGPAEFGGHLGEGE